MDNEIVQYFIVNKDVKMSSGKVAAQVAHAATISTINMVSSQNSKFPDYFNDFVKWYQSGMKKVILKGSEEELKKLEESGFYCIRDAGHTEIEKGTLTVVALPPMPKLVCKRFVGHLSVY
ncbi:aminoacyl-tRNA hydrolase [Bacillus sp. 31A1R]|uniref:peptidyl-tRNA hydrolase n=1 Tax=Robertmurraya mangrovi TaxID=3098077 RepID=A0ABU5IWP3_9BACI|nr:aminoacyl-tRNA hydrolase [Bacillus sp. 31A1R]MDZ5471588.1 aminoacyl-tRNA hydrolase [Bacillus sp. 31A1R]